MISRYVTGDFNRIDFLPEDAQVLDENNVTPDMLEDLDFRDIYTLEDDGYVYAILGIIKIDQLNEVFVFRSERYTDRAIALAKACKKLLRNYLGERVLAATDKSKRMDRWAAFLGFTKYEETTNKIFYHYSPGAN